ncbi:unnamed protein product [Bursaphelenchus xylophilus]|uniref:(pine wood nematode) hypothetical protein n=1 Tax=Bursaphelenchus xylophilus TaxID=6326 RepID=A0A1I7RJV5_BURXY|nr:unnamed protein product [Bursaphelenchus xylophilus]CAG9129092.1 unnamed protein product [Bursaphelenchus xylophilus]
MYNGQVVCEDGGKSGAHDVKITLWKGNNGQNNSLNSDDLLGVVFPDESGNFTIMENVLGLGRRKPFFEIIHSCGGICRKYRPVEIGDDVINLLHQGTPC